MPRVASFHLAAPSPQGGRLQALPGLTGERRRLARVPGLVLGRYLGTGRAMAAGSGAQPDRWAIFAVWEDDAALEEWLASSRLLARWAEQGTELFGVRLAPLTAHGRWGGVEPFPGLAGVHYDDGGGPVAVLTRARVRLPRLRRFSQASAVVDAALGGAEGRLAAVAVGEWPVGWQGTFSLWRSRDDLTAFAYGNPDHAEVVRRTREERWYGEELFARFRPYRHEGTWDGRDPLADPAPPGVGYS